MLHKANLSQNESKKLSNMSIKEVWEDNFIEEIERLSLRLDKYKYIAMVQ